MILIKALDKESVKIFNGLVKNAEIVDMPKKKNSNYNNFAGKHIERCNCFNKCEQPDIKTESTT